MHEPLQEYADSRGVTLRVDRAAGVLRGVKLIGLESANRRRYRPEALATAVSLYEGAKVNVNHPKSDPLAPRDYRDRLGVVRQVEFRADEGLFGNLHFNPKHALAEQLAWDAEHNPGNVGFSHNVLARLSREGEEAVVEAITHVQSVDLVADPATTHGLFEEQAPADAAAEADGEPASAALAEQLRAAAVRERTLQRRLKIVELLAAHGLYGSGGGDGAASVGEAFYAALVSAADEGHVERLIAERADALRRAAHLNGSERRGPQSVEQQAAIARVTEATASTAEFVRAVRPAAPRPRR